MKNSQRRDPEIEQLFEERTHELMWKGFVTDLRFEAKAVCVFLPLSRAASVEGAFKEKNDIGLFSNGDVLLLKGSYNS